MVRNILIVEDEKDLHEYLKQFLSENQFLVHSAYDGIQALNALKKTKVDLVLLDLGLPNMGGESVCKEIKANYPDLRVVILSARNDTLDIVKGLNLGADDYVTKPFELEELLARINARLRNHPSAEVKKRVANLELDQETYEVRRDGKLIQLTPREYKLLEYLITHKGKVVTREMILNNIWYTSPDIETRSVDVYIGYLRKKVDSGFPQKLIHSVRGFGYIIKE